MSSVDIEQGSEAWKIIRLGKVTASRVADVIAKTKTGYGASRKNYLAELVLERLTGKAEEGFTSSSMQWGTDNEPDARSAYQFEKNTRVVQVGFVAHPHIAMTGASPDGLVGDDGLLEIKCPNSATHLDTLRTNTIPSRYITQMNWQMACTGRQWCDFVSFDPRFPEHMRLFVKRHHRVDADIRALEIDVTLFLKEVDEAIDDLATEYPAFTEAA
ncbi:lambda exonuclease family protein [Ochrobactrum chromiisoli]|uniref:YqaJ viral recombinase family protein n=1 Tax=Ochrobactrum chromiisoli TaxID=2993941 RepID=A0ABT3QUR6_9HYPH|nr:lambda exonuclease family protein [Ochrobactrum chromiisoli]MCX2699360.1 YqaJ viral recombinase family protein [Ochrobactrum chromiisoli]